MLRRAGLVHGFGRLDSAAVDAVLEAVGHRLPRRREALAGLIAREVEVLIMVARDVQQADRRAAGHHAEDGG